MATAKQQPNLDAFGEEARKLYKKIADTSKDYNSRRKEQTDKLREALKPVWEALGEGRAVNGCADKLSWAKWANPSAKHPERYFYMVMRDKKELKSLQSKKRNVVMLRDGLILNAKGLPHSRNLPTYMVVNVQKHGVSLKPLNEKQNIWMLEIRVRPLVAEGERIEPKPKKAEQAKAQAAAA